jgi:hypothetical protein
MRLPIQPTPDHIDIGSEDSSQGYRWQNDWRLVSCAVAVVILVLAVVRENGEGFYTFLRIYVFGLALVLALPFARQRHAIWLLAAIVTAILFNPIIPIEMYREDWVPYDLAAAAGFSWIAMIGPAERFKKPYLKWAPIGFAAAYAAAVALGTASFQTIGDDNNMAVENLMAENLVVENDMEAAAPANWWESSPVVGTNMPSVSIPASPDTDLNSALENAQRAIENAAAAEEDQSEQSNTTKPAPQGDLANRIQDVLDANNNSSETGPHE